jgi:hypothetical protein
MNLISVVDSQTTNYIDERSHCFNTTVNIVVFLSVHVIVGDDLNRVHNQLYGEEHQQYYTQHRGALFEREVILERDPANAQP